MNDDKQWDHKRGTSVLKQIERKHEKANKLGEQANNIDKEEPTKWLDRNHGEDLHQDVALTALCANLASQIQQDNTLTIEEKEKKQTEIVNIRATFADLLNTGSAIPEIENLDKFMDEAAKKGNSACVEPIREALIETLEKAKEKYTEKKVADVTSDLVDGGAHARHDTNRHFEEPTKDGDTVSDAKPKQFFPQQKEGQGR